MMNHQAFAALINQINSHLNNYLKNYTGNSSFYYVKENQYQKGWTDCYGESRPYVGIELNEHQYLAFKYSDSFRHDDLSLKRIKNILKIQNNLINLLKNASPNTKDYRDLMLETKKMLEQGLLDNTMLTNTHRVIHQSYQQNRLLGLGIFSSWWNKSFCQSRANIALEKSLNDLQGMAKNYNLNLAHEETAPKPPSYNNSI